jgi:N-carbamoylputrescine amidase
MMLIQMWRKQRRWFEKRIPKVQTLFSFRSYLKGTTSVRPSKKISLHELILEKAIPQSKDGTDLGLYRKSHIPDGPGYQEKFYFNPGDTGFKVFKTKFATIGIGICWDQWFPEMARALVLMGAEVLFYPTAIGNEPQDADLDSSAHWQRVMQGHAGANVVPLVASNRVGQEVIQTEHGPSKITFYGTSFIAGATGEIVQSADDKSDTVLVAKFDLNQIKVKRHSWGVFRDRRPELYKALLTLDGKTEMPAFSSTVR